MKKTYSASLCKGGLLGGGLYIDDDKITFRTGKITVPAYIRNLELHFKDVKGVRSERYMLLPVAVISMKNGEDWKFFILRRKDFFQVLSSYIPNLYFD